MVWVQENIRNFGGDPDRVTIFGQSAGAASVCYHVVSPLSKGLFQQAISQSGVCQTCDTFPKPLERAVMLAEELGCDTKDTSNMVACLRQKSADDIIAAHQRLFVRLADEGFTIPFPPSVDGVFLPAHPDVILEKGQVNTDFCLLGVNNHEGGFLIPSSIVPNFGQGMDDDTFSVMLKTLVRNPYPVSSQDDIVAVLCKAYGYRGGQNDPQYTFTQIFGDKMFFAPTAFVADMTAGSAHVYLYENQYIPSFLSADRPDWVGCDHDDELLIVAGAAMLDVPRLDGSIMAFSEKDKKTSLDYMAYWANFARTGNPSDGTGGPADSPTVPEWPQYTADNPAYIKLDVTSSADVGLKTEKMKLWNDVIPKLVAASGKD
ncbi:liver carboxylesterase-like [Branchiostoma floridae x Branchiostoma japonicum]